MAVAESPEDILIRKDLLRHALADLSEREQEILFDRVVYEEKYSDISLKFLVSSSRIQQIGEKSLIKARTSLAKSGDTTAIAACDRKQHETYVRIIKGRLRQLDNKDQYSQYSSLPEWWGSAA